MKGKAVTKLGSIGAASAILLIVFICNAWADSPSRDRLITVGGDAQVKVVPDQVTLVLGVSNWDKQLGAAKRANDTIVKQIMASATQHGVPPKDIQTDLINIEPRYKHEQEKEVFLGWFVRKSIVITLRFDLLHNH